MLLNTGNLNTSEFKELLKMMDTPINNESFLELVTKVDSNRDGLISLDDLKQMMIKRNL